MKKNIKFLTAKQVSDYFQMPLRTIQYLSQQGKIKSFKIGGRWKYIREDIEKYLTHGTNFSKEPARRPNNFIERRAHPRINSNFKCDYLINLPPFREVNNEGIIKDLSAGGILLINKDNEKEKGKVSDPITVDFDLVHRKIASINLEGRIVRINNNELGIKFRNVPEETKDKIVQFVG